MLIENWRDSWRMLSVQIQLLWGAACAVFAAMPASQQEALLAFFGFGSGGAVAASFLAQVSAAFAAATIAARVTRQPSLHGAQGDGQDGAKP